MAMSLSYASTPLVGGYMYESLPERLRKLAEEDGSREAFVYFDRNWKRTAISRKDIHDRSISLAKVLVNQGLSPKAKVGFCMTNTINMLIANMAVVCAGGIPYYMGANLKDGSDVIHMMNDMMCELFLIDTDLGDANWKVLEHIWPEKMPKSDTVPSLKTIICNGKVPEDIANRQTLDSLMDKNPEPDTKLAEVQPEDTIAYFCTSGSTGTPKEVIYTHFCIFNWTKQGDYAFEISGASRFFNDRTFSWVVGYPRTYLVEGATRVFVDPQLTSSGKHIEKISDVIADERCDVVYVPNYLMVDLLDKPELSKKFQNVDTILIAGERFPKWAYALKDKGFCRSLKLFYGSTESGGAACFNSNSTGDREDGMMGKPIGGVEIKLVDQSGSVVPRGERGEICVRSSSRCVGYRGNEKLFRSNVDDSSWFHSGDMARMREDGNFVMEGRQKELISIQTNKFFPWSIEQTLKKMPGVLHAFAIGVPDKRSFEVVCACVLPKEGVTMTPDDVKKYCDGVFLEESAAMVVTTKPAYHVILEAVPLTRSGKLDRLRIRAMATEMLGI